MFDHKQCKALRSSLPPFSLERSYASMTSIPLSMQLYMEFYGFFNTIKGIELDYYCGHRSVPALGFSDGAKLNVFTHFWRLPDSKACVFVVHGLFDHVGLFQKIVRFLLAQGYSVVAIDLPGHGLSEGDATSVRRFEDYAAVLKDTHNYFKPYLYDQPCFGLGQSTGAAILMAVEFSNKVAGQAALFQRLVFLGPLVRPRGARVGRYAFWLLRHFIRHTKRDLSSPNSNDPEFHRFLAYHDPLQSRVLSIHWIGAMFCWIDGFDRQPSIDIPLLIVQGTNDRVVDWRFNVPAIEAHFPNAQVSYIEGAMHHLANEAEPWLKVVLTGVGRFFRRPQKAQ